MAGPELLLDSNIRLWVVLPIVIITFFVGMIRHYVSILLQSDKKLTQEQVSDRSALSRIRRPHSPVTLGKKVQGFCSLRFTSQPHWLGDLSSVTCFFVICKMGMTA